jgi:hypothetical protein
LRRGRDEDLEHAVSRAEQDQVRAPAEELEEDRPAFACCCVAHLDDCDAVSPNRSDLDQSPAFQVLGEASEERAERTFVTGNSLVLEVEAWRVRVGGEPKPHDPRGVVRGLCALEHDDCVAGRVPEDLADPRRPDERSDLAAQLGDVRRGEVQTFSPSRS